MAEAAGARARVLRGALLPGVALRLSATYANPDPNAFPNRVAWGSYWDAGLVLSWTLDAGVRWHEASSARLEAQAARAGVQARKRESEIDLARARAELELAPRRLAIAAERVALAERRLAQFELSLEAGRATPPEVMDREADLALARAARQKVAFDVVIAHETACAIGGAYGPDPREARQASTPGAGP